MRFLLNILCLACVVVVGTALYFNSSDEANEAALMVQTREAVHTIDQILKLKATADETALNERGHAITVDVKWFKDGVPRNPMLGKPHPWLEIASEAEAGLLHPPVRLAVSECLAEFWYNPYQGVVRARVPVMISDSKSTALYNRINGTSIANILEYESSRDEVFKSVLPLRPTVVVTAEGVHSPQPH